MKNNSLILFILILFDSNLLFSQEQISKNDSLATVSFAVVGDLMVHSPQFKSALVDSNKYDFKPVFEEIKPYLEKADFTMGNLETVFAGKEKGYSGYPIFNTPDEFLDALKYAGFDLLFTANNHAYDKGKNGIERTIKIIEENGIQYSGTFKTKEEQDSIFIRNINGIKFTVLSYSYLTNVGIPKENIYLLNIIEKRKIRKDILKAKESGLDFVIVYFHFGDEYGREPSGYQKDIVENTIKYGADIILASHTHTIQPIEIYKPIYSKFTESFVTYSLGNFISNQRWRYSDAGVILNFAVSKNITKDSLFISELNFIPTWVHKSLNKNGSNYKILPAEIYEQDLINFSATESDKKLMKQSFEDTVDIITKYSNQMKVKSVLKE